MRKAAQALFAPILLLSACAAQTAQAPTAKTAASVDKAAAEAALLQTDRDFSAFSAQQGMAAAIDRYFAPDAVSLQPNEPPLLGLDAIRAASQKLPQNFFLTWEPRKAEVAASGELGYSWGEYKLQERTEGGTPTMRLGKYVTVWRRQPDGAWKAIVGMGNPSPAPQP